MGRQHVRDGLLTVHQSKTGATLQIPLHPELQAVLAATPAENMTFLVGRDGKPYSAEAFGLWFKASVESPDSPICRRMDCERRPVAGWRSLDVAPMSLPPFLATPRSTRLRAIRRRPIRCGSLVKRWMR